MINRFVLLGMAAVLGAFVACTDKSTSGEKGDGKAGSLEGYDYGKLCYALGTSAGSFIRQQGVVLDEQQFINGLKEGYAGKASITDEEIKQLMQEFMGLKQQAESEEQLKVGARFLDSVSKLEGVIRDSSGLLYRIHEPGSGEQPVDSSFVRMHYVAKFANGEVLDSSRTGEPVILSLLGVIRGWTIGVPKLKTGGKATLYVPSDLAYGPHGRPGAVPGNAALQFEVELVGVLTPEEVELYKQGKLR